MINAMDIVNESENPQPVKRLGRKPYENRDMVRKFTACRLAPRTIVFIEEVQSAMNPKKRSVGRAIDRIVETIADSGIEVKPD